MAWLGRSPVGNGDRDVVVVVPAFRVEAVLHTTLASVAGQSVLPAEVVVVDDASDDDTAVVARRWTNILPLTVLSQSENLGPAAARRRAIESSSSPLIALLDADDVWRPDHLSSLLDLHAAQGGIATADAFRWLPGGSFRSRTHREHFPVPQPHDQHQAILRANFVFVGSLFARADHDAAGGFRDGFSGAEDWDLWIRMIRNRVRVHGSGLATCMYRLSPGGLSAGKEIHGVYLAVLEAALADATESWERDVLAASIARYRSRHALDRAHRAARSGDARQARRFARVAMGGSARVQLEAAALLAAPASVVRLGDALRRRYW